MLRHVAVQEHVNVSRSLRGQRLGDELGRHGTVVDSILPHACAKGVAPLFDLSLFHQRGPEQSNQAVVVEKSSRRAQALALGAGRELGLDAVDRRRAPVKPGEELAKVGARRTHVDHEIFRGDEEGGGAVHELLHDVEVDADGAKVGAPVVVVVVVVVVEWLVEGYDRRKSGLGSQTTKHAHEENKIGHIPPHVPS